MADFYCVRDGEAYDKATHPVHPQDNDQPILARLDKLAVRQQALAGKLDAQCPVCNAGGGSECSDVTGGETAKATHPERLARFEVK